MSRFDDLQEEHLALQDNYLALQDKHLALQDKHLALLDAHGDLLREHLTLLKAGIREEERQRQQTATEKAPGGPLRVTPAELRHCADVLEALWYTWGDAAPPEQGVMLGGDDQSVRVVLDKRRLRLAANTQRGKDGG